MRDVRKIGRRTWLARTTGGALAVWTSLNLSGCGGWAVSIGMPDAAQSVANNEREPVPSDIHRVRLGLNDFTTAYIVVRGNEAAIVDTGVYDSHKRIGEVLQTAGLNWDAIRHLILTHHHNDHVGSVRDILRIATAATVWAGAADIPQMPANKEIKAAEDGAEIFGLRVIATPGHTLGHISVYDEAASTFISGDAVNTINGTPALAGGRQPADMVQAVASAKKIAALGFEKAFFMHGDPIEKGAAAEIGKLAMRLPNDAAALARMLGAEGLLRELVDLEGRDHPAVVMPCQVAEQDVAAGAQRERTGRHPTGWDVLKRADELADRRLVDLVLDVRGRECRDVHVALDQDELVDLFAGVHNVKGHFAGGNVRQLGDDLVLQERDGHPGGCLGECRAARQRDPGADREERAQSKETESEACHRTLSSVVPASASSVRRRPACRTPHGSTNEGARQFCKVPAGLRERWSRRGQVTIRSIAAGASWRAVVRFGQVPRREDGFDWPAVEPPTLARSPGPLLDCSRPDGGTARWRKPTHLAPVHP